MVLRYKLPKIQAADCSKATSSSTSNHHGTDKPTSNRAYGRSAYHLTCYPTCLPIYRPTYRPTYLPALAQIPTCSKIAWWCNQIFSKCSKRLRHAPTHIPTHVLISAPGRHNPGESPCDPLPTEPAQQRCNNNSLSNIAKQIRNHIRAPGMEKHHPGKSIPTRKGLEREYW
jgi:hypothetical protein